MNKQLQIVIAHYNNFNFFDVLSTINIDNTTIIYNKSNENIENNSKTLTYNNIIVEKLKNIGREGETYLHHIISNYDELSEYTLFIQDDTNNHIPDIFRFVEKTKQIIHANIPVYQYETTWNQNEKITNRLIRDGRCGLSTFSHDYVIRDACQKLNIRLPSIYVTPTCAFFILHKSTIYKYSKDFYIELRKWLLEDQENGYILEHIWKLIFDSTNTGITKKKAPKESLNDLVKKYESAANIIINFMKKYASNR